MRARIEAALAAGTYDQGVETIRAESLRIVDRHTIYTHPATGALTQALEIVRRDRTEALALDDAIALLCEPNARLMLNARSGAAAVLLPAPSLTLDDGSVEARVRLARPTERKNMPRATFAGSSWHESDEAAFAAAWTRELAALPAFTETHFHIVAGLLLPIWQKLPPDGCRVYRLQAEDGERVIGRLVAPAWVGEALAQPLSLGAEEALAALVERGDTLMLDGGLTLRRTLVMGLQRVELTGANDAQVPQLKALGLLGEIISWKLRLFVPLGDTAPAILERLFNRHPPARLLARAAKAA
jgi:hypothetical protein